MIVLRSFLVVCCRKRHHSILTNQKRAFIPVIPREHMQNAVEIFLLFRHCFCRGQVDRNFEEIFLQVARKAVFFVDINSEYRHHVSQNHDTSARRRFNHLRFGYRRQSGYDRSCYCICSHGRDVRSNDDANGNDVQCCCRTNHCISGTDIISFKSPANLHPCISCLHWYCLACLLIFMRLEEG